MDKKIMPMQPNYLRVAWKAFAKEPGFEVANNGDDGQRFGFISLAAVAVHYGRQLLASGKNGIGTSYGILSFRNIITNSNH